LRSRLSKNFSRWLTAALVLSAALVTGASAITAATDPPRALPKQVLDLVTLEFPPLQYADHAGVPQGPVVEVVRRVFDMLDIDVVIRVMPWVRSLDAVRKGEADAIFTAYRNPEREVFLDYSREVLLYQAVGLYARNGDNRRFNGDLESVKGTNIGTVSTISYGRTFDRARDRKMFRTDRAEDIDTSFRKLMAGRVDFVVSNRFTGRHELARLGLTSEIEELPMPIEVMPSHLAFSKARGHAKLRDRFDAALNELKASGEYAKILSRHGIHPPRK